MNSAPSNVVAVPPPVIAGRETLHDDDTILKCHMERTRIQRHNLCAHDYVVEYRDSMRPREYPVKAAPTPAGTLTIGWVDAMLLSNLDETNRKADIGNESIMLDAGYRI